MLTSSLLFFSLLAGSAFADNDWSTPCLSGVCQYDLPASNGSASGTLMIWGSDNAISDITPAAGWEIIDCSPDALSQDIRLVCKDASSANCAHLYSGSTSNNNNAVGKVVRLPENCGKSAFAVVTKAWTPQDQTIPSNVAGSLTRRDGTQPTVKGLHLDTNFASTPPTSAGPVNFAVQAANVPGASGNSTVAPQQQRRSNSRIFGRGIGSFVTDAINSIASLNDFNVDSSKTLPPVDVDKTFNLVDKSISCPPVDASVKVDVDAKAHAVVSFGVAASGTIVPPKVSDFAIISGLTANIDGSLIMHATASGSLDSGKIELFQVGIPGLDFPGVLTIGPSFQINGQAKATLDLNADMTVGISYNIDNAQLTFPAKKGTSGSFNIGDTPLKLSASPSATATGTVEAHLIPTINFGVSALDNTVSANIFLDLDASATMTLTAQAGANVAATVNPRSDLENSGKAARGYYVLSPPSLNSRAPQFDDSGDGDDAEDDSANTADDGSSDNVDGSNDTSGDSSGGAGDDVDSSTNGDNTDGTDDSDTSDDAGTDTDTDTNDTFTGADDGSDNTDSGDAEADGSAATDDNTPDDSDPSTDSADNSDNTDSSDTTTDNTDTSDDASPSTTDTATDSAESAAPTTDSTDSSDGTSPSATATADDSAASAAATAPAKVALTDASTTFGGCFSVDSALDVNAGADGSFFGLFDKNTKVELFSKKFELFKKCFGSSATRRSLPGIISRQPLSPSRFFIFSRAVHSSLERRGFSLTCPKAGDGSGSQQTITDQTVAASAITKE